MSPSTLLNHRHKELVASRMINPTIFSLITGLATQIPLILYPIVFIIWALIFQDLSERLTDNETRVIVSAMHHSSNSEVTILHHSDENQRLWTDVHVLARHLGIKHPVNIGVIHKPINDAVSVSLGNSHLILFYQGLLTHLNDDELDVAVAHELGHFYDTFVSNRFKNRIKVQHLCLFGLIALSLFCQFQWLKLNTFKPVDLILILFLLFAYEIMHFIDLMILRHSELYADDVSLELTDDFNSCVSLMLKIYDPSDSLNDFDNMNQVENALHQISFRNGFGSIFDDHPSPYKRIINYQYQQNHHN